MIMCQKLLLHDDYDDDQNFFYVYIYDNVRDWLDEFLSNGRYSLSSRFLVLLKGKFWFALNLHRAQLLVDAREQNQVTLLSSCCLFLSFTYFFTQTLVTLSLLGNCIRDKPIRVFMEIVTDKSKLQLWD
jgi:hypothetical protein